MRYQPTCSPSVKLQGPCRNGCSHSSLTTAEAWPICTANQRQEAKAFLLCFSHPYPQLASPRTSAWDLSLPIFYLPLSIPPCPLPTSYLPVTGFRSLQPGHSPVFNFHSSCPVPISWLVQAETALPTEHQSHPYSPLRAKLSPLYKKTKVRSQTTNSKLPCSL